MTRSIARITFSGLLALGLGAAVHASAADKQGVCADDRAKYCADVKPGGGAGIKCLAEHEAQLTPACHAHIQEAKAKVHEVSEACSADAEKHCKGVERGHGHLAKCLAEHEAELSAPCRSEVDQAQSKIHEMKGNMEQKKAALEDACQGDITKSCGGVKPGHGNVVKCLKEHEATLSPACKQALP